MTNWNELTDVLQFEEIKELSNERPVLIYKHSTTCGISGNVLHNLETYGEALAGAYELYYLDLLAYRSVSNAAAEVFDVIHQSPQVIIVENGEVVHHASHFAIQPEKLVTLATS